MRLIDADALKKNLKSVTLSNGTLLNTNTVLLLLDKYPTAYDVDKVVEQLNNLKRYSNPYDSYYEEASYRATEFENSVVNRLIDDVIKIVKVGGRDER
jgi:hypothetical protein